MRPIATPFEVELSRYATRFARAIYVGAPPPFSPSSILNSATMTLLKLEDLLIGVTCQHVLEKYRQLKARGETVIFQIGALQFDPIKYLISEDKRLDLVTFNLTSVASEAVGLPRSSFIEPLYWPPESVSEGDVLCLAGFPGQWRDQINSSELRFHSFGVGATFVQSATEAQFVVSLHSGESLVTVDKGKVVDFLGGLSGGPVFCWCRDLVLRPELVGFVYEYDSDFDRMIIRAARVLNSDGTLMYYP
jgi:hypothetical protein